MSYFVDGRGMMPMSQSCYEWAEEYDQMERDREELEREREELNWDREHDKRFVELDASQIERYIKFYDFIERWVEEDPLGSLGSNITLQDVEDEARKIEDLGDIFCRIIPPKNMSICDLFDYDKSEQKIKFDFLVKYF